MKRAYTLAVSVLVALTLAASCLIAGCNMQNIQTTAADLQAQVAIACPAIQNTLTEVSALVAPTAQAPRIQADIAKAQPVLAAACTANTTINTTTIQSLANTALPAVSDIIGSLNLPAAQVKQYQTVLVTAEVALNIAGVVEAQIQAAQAAAQTAPASSSTATVPK